MLRHIVEFPTIITTKCLTLPSSSSLPCWLFLHKPHTARLIVLCFHRQWLWICLASTHRLRLCFVAVPAASWVHIPTVTLGAWLQLFHIWIPFSSRLFPSVALLKGQLLTVCIHHVPSDCSIQCILYAHSQADIHFNTLPCSLNLYKFSLFLSHTHIITLTHRYIYTHSHLDTCSHSPAHTLTHTAMHTHTHIRTHSLHMQFTLTHEAILKLVLHMSGTCHGRLRQEVGGTAEPCLNPLCSRMKSGEPYGYTHSFHKVWNGVVLLRTARIPLGCWSCNILWLQKGCETQCSEFLQHFILCWAKPSENNTHWFFFPHNFACIDFLTLDLFISNNPPSMTKTDLPQWHFTKWKKCHPLALIQAFIQLTILFYFYRNKIAIESEAEIWNSPLKLWMLGEQMKCSSL